MARSLPGNIFSQYDIRKAAAHILQTKPDPVPAFRLMNEVLRLPTDDPTLQQARTTRAQSRWLEQLQGAQLADGSWGRFHSQDTKAKTVFRTSEEAIDRAFSLGLDVDHPVLALAKTYIENVLRGHAHISDWDEKNDAWPVLIKIILAGKLTEIDPTSKVVDPYWEYMAEVARQAFSSGEYRPTDEMQSYLKISGIHVKRSFLQSRYAIALLSARKIPAQLERALVQWIWQKPDGMSYLQAPLSRLMPRMMAYWLKSLNILCRYPSWREVSVNTLNQLWNQRDEHGLWDFGAQSTLCADFPISENWRQKLNRKVDFSTCVLVILRRYFDYASR